MTPERDLTPAEEQRLGRVLDAWQVAPPRPGLALSIALAAKPKVPGFGWTWPRLATLAAAACLGLMVGWIDVPGDNAANAADPGIDSLFFPGDTGDALDGDFS